MPSAETNSVDIGPLLLADGAENRIRDSGHRGQEERKGALLHKNPRMIYSASAEDGRDSGSAVAS